MGYWSNLISSFAKGGQTPLEALFDIEHGSVDSVADLNNHFGSHSWVNYAAPDDNSSVISSDVVSDNQSVVDYIDNSAQEAVEQQNEAAQSSADSAMEFEKEMYEDYKIWSESMVDKANAYNLELSNTEIQRRMQDLKEAGINPKLVGSIGGASSIGSSVPSASQPSGHVASMSMKNITALSSLVQTYISGADALERNENDFAQSAISDVIDLAGLLIK